MPSALLDALQGVVALVGHLAMQDFDAVEAHFRGHVNTALDVAQLVLTELPEGVGGDADAIAAPLRRLRGLLRGKRAGASGERGARQECAAVDGHGELPFSPLAA
jgi:hypothetical protein